MSARQGLTRTIHPRALAELGEEACIVALEVARDLRSGTIPWRAYDQEYYTDCGTGCCIAGHIAERMGIPVSKFINRAAIVQSSALRFRPGTLFASGNPPAPEFAADAIERYVYDGSETPWKAS